MDNYFILHQVILFVLFVILELFICTKLKA